MNTQSPYQLCAVCLGLRDWAEDPVVRSKGRQNREYHDSPSEHLRAKTHRCSGLRGKRRCQRAINPLMRLCRDCAERDGHCQHCGKPMIGEAGHASGINESQPWLVDLFTVLVKTYGYASANDLLRTHAEEIGGPIEETLQLTLAALEKRIPDREGLRMLYRAAQRGDIPARCTQCVKPHWPAVCRAARCGHWTHGSGMTWCQFCAISTGECATCGTPTAPGTEGSAEN